MKRKKCLVRLQNTVWKFKFITGNIKKKHLKLKNDSRTTTKNVFSIFPQFDAPLFLVNIMMKHQLVCETDSDPSSLLFLISARWRSGVEVNTSCVHEYMASMATSRALVRDNDSPQTPSHPLSLVIRYSFPTTFPHCPVSFPPTLSHANESESILKSWTYLNVIQGCEGRPAERGSETSKALSEAHSRCIHPTVLQLPASSSSFPQQNPVLDF